MLIHRTVTGAVSIACALGVSLAANAQGISQSLIPEKIAQLQQYQPKQNAAAQGAGAIRNSAFAAAAAPAARPRSEIVLQSFSSAPHGAYPSSGVIRDAWGNFYGTTNGSYSDLGGGGSYDAGVVYKIDPFGNQTVLYNFTGGTDGGSPNGLVRDGFGNLYGTTSSGGAYGAGTIFKVDAAGHETVLYSFTGGNDGGSPTDLIRDTHGNLYGTADGGGTSGYGVVFKLDTSGNETAIYSFTGGSDGAFPSTDVALDPSGNLYGATLYGGNAFGPLGAGVIFKVDTSGNESVLYTFTGGSDGGQPNGVTRDATGNLYGTTSDGGMGDNGVVFKVNTTGQERVLYTFTGGNDGGSSFAGVTLDRAGNLFGTTNFGGTANLGVLFKVDPTGHETVLHTFVRGAEGNQPYESGVILDQDCNLYGTTSFSGAGGQGTVYKVDPFGNASLVYAFPGNEGGQYSYNSGLVLGANGQLYGTADRGGDHGAGVLYELDAKSGEHVLYTFDYFTASGFGQPTGTVIRDLAGNFYGTTFIGQADFGYGYGVVYKIDTAGHAHVLHNFTGGADGGNPYGGVILDAKGSVYGTASGGGAANSGAVFKIDVSGNETVLYSFTGGADGGYPYSSLVRDSAGNLYGTTGGGGVAGAGVVFRIDPSGNETVLYSFTGGADGGYPLSGLIRDAAGNLYGAAQGGGAAGAGVVYEVDPSGLETVLYNFTGGADGGTPAWGSLVRDSVGDLFGTTLLGGADNAGVVFKVDSTGNETVLYSFTGKDDGANPQAGVVLGPAGQLYGVTPFGGPADVGVVFEVTP